MTVGIVGGGAAGLFLGNLIEGATLFEGRDRAVSYTHLTLPTICSV